MPPISDQENNSFSSSSTHPNKVTPKTPTTGGLEKGNRRNGGKDGGNLGVLAAVTKNKIVNKTPAQSPRVQSPEMASPPNGVTSPLLDALSSAALDRSPSQNTNEWAKNVPAFSNSQNLIHLGESPPTVPSSYEERLTNFGWNIREQRGVPNGISSASPPSNRRRPLSYQLDGNYQQGFDDHRSQMSSYAARRSSMYSHHSRYAQNPPLPHQNQAHFYGAPELALSPPIPGLIPGENGFYCGFDSLPTASQSIPAEKVIVAGYEGGINIYVVLKRGLHKISSIEGLRGGVYNAKILPWNLPGTNSRHFPLIAVVVHGPVWASSEASSREGGSNHSEAISATQNESASGSPHVPGISMNDEPIDYYQTTVEVYSLRTKQHVATLLSVPKTHLAIPTNSPLFTAPPPVGSLTIRADSGHIVVASGTTGETWIFRQASTDIASSELFRCIGKVWTCVQHGVAADPVGPMGLMDGDWQNSDPISVRKLYNASILSINGRWLAYCPSAPSSQVSLRAAVPSVASTARIPGLNAQAPPQLPGVSCTVETPGGESMMKHIVQIGTQKFLEGGKIMADLGIQTWNNYWNKPSPGQSPPSGDQYQVQNLRPNMGHQFPPTHGIPTPAPLVTKDPGLISIIDLESLAQHSSSTASSPHPLATFKVPHGCSYLSFAPSGLALFTASRKGDLQCVWDLMRIQYAKSSFLKVGLQGAGIQGPHVRQIAQFSRMTIARIVDVVWTSPHGERAAMVTEPGTVHILDLPASAFAWPPPRRRGPSQKPDEGASEVAGPALTATGMASSAVSSLWTAAQPLVSRRRRSSVGISARTVTAQAGHGTQVIAAGISRSVGAATGKMNEMRKSARTKLHLPNSLSVPSTACILLFNGKRNDSVMAVAGGIVRFYSIKNRRADRPVDKQKASRGARYVEFRIPNLPDYKFAPEITRDLNQVGDLDLTERDVDESRWNTGHSPSPTPQLLGTGSSIPQAEIESNAPYQPFHTDRRVGMHVFSYDEAPLTSPSVSALLSPPPLADNVKTSSASKSTAAWAFGGPLKMTKLDVGPPHNPDDDPDESADHHALPSSAIERVLRVADSTEEMEQIVITTRRRKGASRSGPEILEDAEDGFFEDDCEVLDFASQRV